MSFSVVFRRIAKREFDDAISWYQDRREGLGREFSVAVEQQLGRIALRQTGLRVLERNSSLRRALGYSLLGAVLSLKFFMLVAEFPDR